MFHRLRSRLMTGAAAMLISTATALAHHGWAWTEDEFFEIEGVIVAMSFGNPHPALDVDIGGEIWRVDLATPAVTARAGFTEEKARVGSQIKVIGNRSRDASERLMKAVRIVVEGETFDVYPNRVPED